METISQLIIFLFALSILVMVHELGHLLFAKKFNVYCYEFSIGMGPRIYSKKGKETQYSLKAFPIGGSVMMAGEEFDEATKKALGPLYEVDVPVTRTAFGIKRWKRLFVFGGGALFNFVFGLILFFIVVNAQNVKYNTESTKIKVETNSLISSKGLQNGDEINALELRLGGLTNVGEYTLFPVETYYDILEVLDGSKNKDFDLASDAFIPQKEGEYQEVKFHYSRFSENGIKNQAVSDPIRREYNKKGLVVFGFSPFTYPLTLGDRFKIPFQQFFESSLAIFKGLGSLFTGAIGNVSGPVGIFNMSSQMASFGIMAYFSFLALLSINLGVFNLIPFPGLDGAAIFMTVGEMITKKDIPTKAKGMFNLVGFFILIGLIILVSIKDIIELF